MTLGLEQRRPQSGYFGTWVEMRRLLHVCGVASKTAPRFEISQTVVSESSVRADGVRIRAVTMFTAKR